MLSNGVESVGLLCTPLYRMFLYAVVLEFLYIGNKRPKHVPASYMGPCFV